LGEKASSRAFSSARIFLGDITFVRQKFIKQSQPGICCALVGGCNPAVEVAQAPFCDNQSVSRFHRKNVAFERSLYK